MKLATKLTILVSLGILMVLSLLCIVYLFNARISSSMDMALNLNDANESILTAIIEEKKLLNDETNADMSVVNEQLRVASDLIASLDNNLIFAEKDVTFASLYDLLKKYRIRFNELTETLRKFDEKTDTLNQNLYEYSQNALSVLQKIRMEIGMAMINAEEVDENIRSFSDVVKNLLLWSRQVNLVLNQDLFVKKNEEQFREKMDNTFEQLELKKKNAFLLKSYIQDNDYVDFINASIVLVDELPGRTDNIRILWNRKNDLAARLDTLRKKLLIRKNHILFQAKQHISQLYKNQSLWLITSFLAILIVYIAAGLRVSRSISHPLNRIIRGVDNISRQTAVAASQFTNSSQNLAQNAAEQASSIEEITATLEQLSAMSHETTKLTQGADELMNQNIIKSGQSLKSFVELTRKMKQVEADSDKIDQIISDIDGIAFQTNLLALNAAVEAARAGEAGSGFGVVAEEVRNLAKKTAEAAQNTQNLLRGTVTGISEAVKTIQTINSDFEGIIESATVMGEKTEAITSASKEQSLGIEQITISAGEIDQSTQQIAASSQQSASASEELNSQAREMNHYVIELSTLIRGKTESPEKPGTNKGATGFVQARPASTRVNRR